MGFMSRPLVVQAYLLVCIVFGGGGSPSPLSELVVQVAALVALPFFFFLSPCPPGSRGGSGNVMALAPVWNRAIIIGCALLALIPLTQLAPLPPSLWQSLPYRSSEVASMELVGQSHLWRPLSVAPYATFASLLSLIPPVAMIVLVMSLTLEARTRLLETYIMATVVAALIGVIQLASGSANWARFYEVTNYGYATGFQANRNADADMLLVGLMALISIVMLRPPLLGQRTSRVVTAAVALFLIISIFTTGSRTGTALMCLLIACVLASRAPGVWRKSKKVFIAAFATLTLIGIGAVSFATHNATLDKTIGRFSNVGADARLSDIWPDTVYVLEEAWPVGTGIGTFVPVFQSAERLEVVDFTRPNRAHDDYLEFTLEAGLAAVLFLLCAVVAIFWRGASIILATDSKRRRAHAVFALGTVSIFLLHSFVDYPMRSMSLAATAALAIGLLSERKGSRANLRPETSAPRLSADHG